MQTVTAALGKQGQTERHDTRYNTQYTETVLQLYPWRQTNITSQM